MDPLPPLRKLQYVLAVARDLHFRKAAERLHVSQPAISRAIREHEEEIGFEIFHRDNHFVSLTKAGRVYVSEIEGIVAHMECDFAAAARRARAVSREIPDEYIVGHSPFAPMQIRRIVLELQQEEFRDVPVRLRILPTSELLNAIDNEVVQAGITYAPIDDPGISSIPIVKEHWVAIVPVKGKFSEVAIANIAEFKGEPVISNGADRTHPALFRKLEMECVAKGFSLRAVAEINSPHEAFDLVAGKAGIALLPTGVCDDLPPGVRAIRIADISPLEIVLIHRPDGSSFLQEFAERIRVKMSLNGRARDGRYAEPLAFPSKRKLPASAPKSKPGKLNRSVG